MKKTGILATSALALSMAFGSAAHATDFATYAGWSPEVKSQFGGWLIGQMEQYAVDQHNKEMLKCIQSKYITGSPEMSKLQGALAARAENNINNRTVEEVGAGQILMACAPKLASR